MKNKKKDNIDIDNGKNVSAEETKSTLDSLNTEDTSSSADNAVWEEAEAAEKKITELENKVAEAEKQRLMALAEMDNQRKRFVNEKDALRKNIQNDTVFPFLQVFDHFKMAVDAASNSNNFDSLIKGMEMIQNEFERAFEELGLVRIESTGKDFDPKFHEAVAYEPSDTVPKDKIIRQWCSGFRIGDRLVKPSSVVVSSGPAEEK